MNQILDYGENEQNTSVDQESINMQSKTMEIGRASCRERV